MLSGFGKFLHLIELKKFLDKWYWKVKHLFIDIFFWGVGIKYIELREITHSVMHFDNTPP